MGGFRYAFLLQFRPAPLLPNQVYRFDPITGSVRVVADGFYRSDGIAFSPDGSTAFMCVLLATRQPMRADHTKHCSTDTGLNEGFFGNNQTLPATM